MKGIKSILLIILGFIIFLLSIFYIRKDFIYVSDTWEIKLAIISIILLMYSILTWIVMKLDFFSPTFLIFVSLYLFHLGNIIVIGFNLAEVEYLNNLMIYRYDEYYSFLASVYSIGFLFFYIIGVNIFKVFYKSTKYINKVITKPTNLDLYICNLTGKILLIVSLPISLYLDMIKFSSKAAGGYIAVYQADYRIFGLNIGGISNLLLPGILLILSSNRNNKKKFIIISSIVIIYYTIYMVLSGRRADGILIILTILFIYHAFFKININIKLLIGGYLLAGILNFVAQTRGITDNLNILQMINQIFVKSNPITTLLLEMGGTIRSVILLMMAIPSNGYYVYGATYILGPIGMILKGTGISNCIENFTNFTMFLRQPERGIYINNATSSIGGSAIAECFFNFGVYGILFAVFFGAAIVAFENKLTLNKERPIIFAMLCSTLYLVLRYTREYFSGMFWVLLVQISACYIIYNFVKNYLIKQKYFRMEEFNE
ncbi:O-antigen polysaccharide polymerase Wzy [Clostridium perfringens]|uniref:O-antigen polysaccharide polymerase Wzy n=1 Tax=Clostridium perfringens TaxID=1502 RepID=UPI001C85DC08|nr:O-antigen polysaccharide polymerase Wzy [Clostridium perfringens]ELC8389843.1 O-antigen polysaccharide polymerase Wzy [Clostridium perfringens]